MQDDDDDSFRTDGSIPRWLKAAVIFTIVVSYGSVLLRLAAAG